MQRRQQLFREFERFACCLPEDIILKSYLVSPGNQGFPDRQWRDHVLKVQAYRLDFNYLTQWAETLKLSDLIAR